MKDKIRIASVGLNNRGYWQTREIADIPGVEVVSGEEYYGKGYDDSLRRLPSVEKAERLLGFKAQTPIDVVLRESLTWFVGHYSNTSHLDADSTSS